MLATLLTLFTKKISSSFTPGAKSFFSYLPTQPSAPVKAAYNVAWKDYPEVMALHDRLWINFSEYEDNSLVSLVNPSSTIKTKISTPAHRKFMGWSGGAGKALNTNFTANTHAVLFTRNSGSVWFYSNLNVNGLKIAIGGTDAGESNGCEIYPNYLGTTYGSVNGGAVGATNSTTIGLISVVRISSTTVKIYKNGILLGTFTDAVGVLASNSIYELASNINGILSYPFDGEISACGICSGTVNQLDLFNMIEAMKGKMPLWSFYGDSITANYNITWEQGWAYKLCQSVGSYFPYNKAVSGKTVQDFVNSNCPVRILGDPGQYVFLPWGVNDCSVPIGILAYKSNYRIVIDDLINNKGASVNQIVLIRRWYITDGPVSALYPPYVNALQEIANEYGIERCYDVNFLEYHLADALHPSPVGGTEIADFMYKSLMSIKTDWANPTSAINDVSGGGDSPWTDAGNVLELDGNYAEYDFYDEEYSNHIKCVFPDFNIPLGATITGWECRVSCFDLAASQEILIGEVVLVKDGVYSGATVASGTFMPATQQYIYFGGGNLAGNTLTPSDCATLGIGFGVHTSAGDGQARVDNIQLRILYTL